MSSLSLTPSSAFYDHSKKVRQLCVVKLIHGILTFLCWHLDPTIFHVKYQCCIFRICFSARNVNHLSTQDIIKRWVKNGGVLEDCELHMEQARSPVLAFWPAIFHIKYQHCSLKIYFSVRNVNHLSKQDIIKRWLMNGRIFEDCELHVGQAQFPVNAHVKGGGGPVQDTALKSG